MDMRLLRGIEIAEQGRINKTAKGWIVPSQSRYADYIVKIRGDNMTCTCPDCQTRNVKCKHQHAVEYFIHKTRDKYGNTVVTKTVRKTYPQNWKAYTKAQTNEISIFDDLLKDLVNTVEEPEQNMGRPKLSIRETLFCAIQKVYSQLSQRRVHTLYRNAENKGQIRHAPHFNATGKLLNREDITPILHRLLALTAMPLKSVETAFAQDSSGFSTSRFGQYFIEKHRKLKRHKWVKAHILVGVKTNTVVSAEITEEDKHDQPPFTPMVMDAYNNGFEIRELLADKAYSSRESYGTAKKVGATAYIPFRSNATGTSRGSLIWTKAYHYFNLHREEFLKHYHQRSNVETSFQMIKSKFGDRVKSKNWTAQKNELLCKLIAHNIVVLIHEMHELGIKPEFNKGA